MAHLPVIANVFRVAFDWGHSAGQIAENVIHISCPGGGATQHDIATALDATIPATVFGNVSSGASVEFLSVTPLDGVSATQQFATTSPHWTGDTGGDMIPAASQIVKAITDRRGRSYRGRVFLPFIAESAQTDGFADSGVTATMTTQWNAWQTALDAHSPSCFFVVASYKLAEARDVQVFQCETALGTQRRRQGRLR